MPAETTREEGGRTSRSRRLSVVLPCRDQADHLGPLLEAWTRSLDRHGEPYEIVVVPNASTDDTADVARRAARLDPRLRVVESGAPGWGRAVLRGLSAARGSDLCYANAARTDPADLVALHRLYVASEAPFAKVRRVRRGAPLRSLGSALFNLEARMLFGIRARDVNGTPKIMARRLFESLRLGRLDDLLDLEVMAKVSRLSVPVVELEVSGFRRHGGRSSTNLASAVRLYTGALGLRRRGLDRG